MAAEDRHCLANRVAVMWQDRVMDEHKNESNF